MITPHFKGLLPLLLIGGCSFALSAKSLSPEEALSGISTNKSTPGIFRNHAVNAKFVKSINTVSGHSAMYLYDMANRPGYVILSADDRLPSILGYSETGNLSATDLPDGLQWWLDMMADEARKVLELIDEDESEGVYTPPSLGPAVEPILTSTWGQTEPYNLYTPVFDDKQSPTGCVATALTQIMNHYKWPLAPQGSITYNDGNKPANTYSITFDGMSFDWNLITDTYDEQSSDESKDAVSTLMKAVGYGVQMNYGKSSSGATDAHALEGMTKYFGYSSDARHLRRESFNRNDWDKLLYHFISAGNPIYYTGRDAVWVGSGGHAFVCDGYDGNGYFHFNWGWNGKYNGYFLTTCMVPEGAGTGGFINGYNYTQSIFANLYPDDGNQYDQFDFVEGKEFSISLSNLSLSVNLVRGLNITNPFEIGISIAPADSDMQNVIPLGEGHDGKNTLNLPTDIFDDLDNSISYDIQVVWRSDSESDWGKVIPISDGLMVYSAVYMGGHLSWNGSVWEFKEAYINQDPVNIMISNFVTNDEDYFFSGKENKIGITLSNQGDDYEYIAGRAYAVNTASGKEELFFNTSFEVGPSQIRDLNLTMKPKELPSGDYYLRFINVNTLQEIPCDKTYAMRVFDESDLTSFDDGVFTYLQIPGQDLILNGTVSGEPVGGDVVIPTDVIREDKSYKVGKILNTLNKLLDKNTLTTLRIDYPIRSLAKNELSSFKAMTELYLPESLQVINDYACAYNESLKKLNLPSGLDYIGNYAFYGIKALEELKLPQVDSIRTRSFYNANLLNELIIPEGVRFIDTSVFYNCDNLTSLELPSTIETIGQYAFISYDGTPMTVKVYRETPPEIQTSTFSTSTAKVSTLVVPKGSKELYMADPNWKKFSNIEEFVVLGIESFPDSADEEYIWFTPAGIKLPQAPTTPGIYIRLNKDSRISEKLILK